MKIRKLLLISPLGILLLIALIIAWWFLGDDEWVREQVEDSVTEMTGRSLSIEGDFAIDWSTNPVVTAQNIHFANPQWATHADLASLDSLEVSIDLFSFLSSRKTINSIAATGLTVALEESPTGEGSWELMPDDTESDLESQSEPDEPDEPLTELPIYVDEVSLTDFTLLHEAPDRNVPLDFHLQQTDLALDSEELLRINSAGRFGGEGFELSGSLQPLGGLIAGETFSHDVRASIGEITLAGKGRIEQLSTFSGVNITLQFSGPRFEWVLTQLALPLFSHGEFDFNLAMLTTNGQTGLTLNGDLGSLEATADGVLSGLGLDGIENLAANVSGDDFGGLLQVFEISGVPREPFSLALDLGHDSGLFRLQELAFTTGEDVVSVSGEVGDWPQLADTDLDFSVSGPDLQRWGEALQTDLLPEADFELKGRIGRTASDPPRIDMTMRVGDSQAEISGLLGRLPEMNGADLLATVRGPVDGTIATILEVGDIPGEDFGLKASLQKDASFIYLNEVTFDLADTQLDVSGKIGNWPELAGTELDVSLLGSDLSLWSPVLGFDAPPASSFSILGKVTPETTGMGLQGVTLKLGDSHVFVEGSVGEGPEFNGTALKLEASGASLADLGFLPGMQDAPALPFRVDGRFGKDDPAISIDSLSVQVGKTTLNLNGQLGTDNQFEGSEFQIRLTAPDISTFGSWLGVDAMPEQGLSVNTEVRRIPDGWAFKLSDGNFAGASFDSEGKYLNLDGQHQVEADSHFASPNLAKLGLIGGIENLPEQAVNVRGFARYRTGMIELNNVRGQVGDSEFTISGKLLNPPTWSGSDISLSASGQDIGQLLAFRDFDGPVPFSLDGSVARNEQGVRMDRVTAKLGSLQAAVDGSIGNPNDLSDTNVQVAVTAPTLKDVGDLIDYPLPDEPFSFSASLQGSPSAFEAGKLELKLGPSDLSGDLSLDLTDKPVINGQLQSDYLDLSWLDGEEDSEKPASDPAPENEQEYIFPDTPIAYSRIDFADSDIQLLVGRLDLARTTFTDINIRSLIKDGNLHIDPFEFRGEYGGLTSGNLSLKREHQSKLTNIVLFMQGKDVKLGIGAAEGQDPETIRKSNVLIDLNGTGATYRDLASSLDGRVEVMQGPGMTESAGLSLFFGNFIEELLNLLNPFSKTEKFTVNECAVAIVNADSGVVVVEPVVSQTDKLTVVAKGVIDLNTEEMHFSFNTKLRKGIGISASMVVNPFIGITGTLSSPIIGLDPKALAVQGSVAVATAGLSLLARSLSDRYFSSKDPCGDAIENERKQREKSDKKKGR